MDDECFFESAAEAWTFYFAAVQGGAKDVTPPHFVKYRDGFERGNVYRVAFTVRAEDMLP